MIKLRYLLFLFACITFIFCNRGTSLFSRKISGPSLYKHKCSSCHGKDAKQFTERVWKHGNSRLEIIQSIKTGYKDAGMPAFAEKLSDEKITAIAQFIVEKREAATRDQIFEAAPATNKFVSKGITLHLDTIASELENPWGIDFLPNGDMLFTERTGKLWQMTAAKVKTEIKGVPPVLAEGQGGLLDVKLHPRFAQNRLIYLSYSKFRDSADVTLSTTAVWRAQLDGDTLLQGDDVFVSLPYATTRHHYGSRLVFDREGYLFITAGERGKQDDFPQHLDMAPGKVHRIRDDGSIPDDNPFYNTPGAVKSVWSYGHRNPQGMTLRPSDGALWETEHGPRGGDELNLIQKSKNYGWPVASYGTHYDTRSFTSDTKKDGIEAPVTYWVPSLAPCGLTFLDSKRYGNWEGDLLVGSLRFKYVNRVHLSGNKVMEQEILLPNIGRVRCIKMSPDGYIYVAVEEPGYIFKLIPETTK